MKELLDMVRRTVREELALRRGPQLATVIALAAHASADDTANYEADLRLKHDGLEIMQVPVSYTHLDVYKRQGQAMCLHCDAHGNLLFTGTGEAETALAGPFASDPWGVPLHTAGPYLYRGRLWHPDLGLYRIGCRWYDPTLRRFLTPDTHTGAPDDARLVNPFRLAGEQRMARAQILGDWLRQPRLRNRHAYCANDPINRFDPDGHWSFGGVLLSLLGVLWTCLLYTSRCV